MRNSETTSFPLNLILALVDDEKVANDILKGRDRYEVTSSIYMALSTLPEDYFKDIIEKRYVRHRSYSQMSRELDSGEAFIKEKEKKALNYLRNPERFRIISVGLNLDTKDADKHYLQMVEDVKRSYEKEIGDLRKEVTVYRTLSETAAKKDIKKLMDENMYETLSAIRINSINLTTRSLGIVRSLGINTVGDLVRKFKMDEFTVEKVHNLGETTYNNVVDALYRLGFTSDDLKPDRAMIEFERTKFERAKEEERKLRRQREKEAAEAKHLQDVKDTEAQKYIIQIRDKILDSAVDGLRLLFDDDVINLMRMNIERMEPNEKVVSILMISEVIDPKDGRSPYGEMISRNGLINFNKCVFGRFLQYRRKANWERYKFRGSSVVELPDYDATFSKFKHRYIRELNLDYRIKQFLYTMGLADIEEVLLMISRGELKDLIARSVLSYNRTVTEELECSLDVDFMYNSILAALRQIKEINLWEENK